MLHLQCCIVRRRIVYLNKSGCNKNRDTGDVNFQEDGRYKMEDKVKNLEAQRRIGKCRTMLQNIKYRKMNWFTLFILIPLKHSRKSFQSEIKLF